jgi:hypothetical protein
MGMDQDSAPLFRSIQRYRMKPLRDREEVEEVELEKTSEEE